MQVVEIKKIRKRFKGATKFHVGTLKNHDCPDSGLLKNGPKSALPRRVLKLSALSERAIRVPCQEGSYECSVTKSHINNIKEDS